MTNSSIYTINTTYLLESLLPINKRNPIIEGYVSALLTGMSYSNELLLEYIYGASTSVYYATSSTYNNGDIVIGGLSYNNSVYQSLTSSNINNLLTNTFSWMQILPSFIGMNERSLYTTDKINLEWNLNRYFGTGFNQQISITGSGTYSNIYITNNPILYATLFIGDYDLDSGYLGDYFDGSDGFDTPFNYNYIINIPTAVFNSFPGGSYSVYNYVNKYNPAGRTYGISLY